MVVVLPEPIRVAAVEERLASIEGLGAEGLEWRNSWAGSRRVEAAEPLSVRNGDAIDLR
jgi:hypothetical protein